MTTEIELKLRLSPHNLNDQNHPLVSFLNQHAEAVDQQLLVNRYYDTPDQALSRARAALRIRRQGDGFEQTLKTAGRSTAGLHQRREWNWPLEGDALDAALLRDDDVQACWPDGVEVEQLQVIFATNFNRRAWRWTLEQDGQRTTAEVVIDLGEVVAGDKSEPLCELELELLDGDAAGLWQMAQQLAVHTPLWLSDISKAERGYQLAEKEVQWAASQSPCSDTMALAQAVPLWLQQQLVLFQRALEKTLWQHDSEAALVCWQHWLTLRHLPQWCGKIIKRKQTKALREALDQMQPGLEALSALTTASRFFNDGTIRPRWLQLAQQLRDDAGLGQALLQLAQWGYQQLPQLSAQAAEGVGVSGETLSHYQHRCWKEVQQALASPHEHWHVNQWAELQSQVSRLQHLHQLRAQLNSATTAASYPRERRLLSDMLNGQSLIQSLIAQPQLLSAEQIGQLQQELPYELWGRWLELNSSLRHSEK